VLSTVDGIAEVDGTDTSVIVCDGRASGVTTSAAAAAATAASSASPSKRDGPGTGE
jgi:hypothetical protein